MQCFLLPVMRLAPMLLQSLRGQSAQDAVSALKPFYFAVHPDFFGRDEKMAKTNESSLQLLSAYMASLSQAESPRPVQLKFYARNADGVKIVEIRLHERDEFVVVRKLLRSCALSTDDLPPDAPGFDVGAGVQPPPDWQRPPPPPPPPPQSFGDGQLSELVNNLSSKAKATRAHYLDLRRSVDATEDELRDRSGLSSIEWVSGRWSLGNYRGFLTALGRVFATVEPSALRHRLRGQSVQFQPTGSFQDANGRLRFGVDDVPDVWMRVVDRCERADWLTKRVGNLEARLCGKLGGARVACRAPVAAEQYCYWLSSLRCTLTAERLREPFLGHNLSVAVVAETNALLLLNSGVIQIPFLADTDELEDYLRRYGAFAKHRVVEQEQLWRDVGAAADSCKRALSLAGLSWDERVDAAQLLVYLMHLESQSQQLHDLFRGHVVHITADTSLPTVRPDGTIVMPIHLL